MQGTALGAMGAANIRVIISAHDMLKNLSEEVWQANNQNLRQRGIQYFQRANSKTL